MEFHFLCQIKELLSIHKSVSIVKAVLARFFTVDSIKKKDKNVTYMRYHVKECRIRYGSVRIASRVYALKCIWV